MKKRDIENLLDAVIIIIFILSTAFLAIEKNMTSLRAIAVLCCSSLAVIAAITFTKNKRKKENDGQTK